MSYDVNLSYKDKIVTVKNFTEGGTYPLSGSTKACLNITYNYAWFFYKCLDKKRGIRWLYGKKAKNTIARLTRAVSALSARTYPDYWAPTPGNAGHALNILLTWARQYPEAIWNGD